MRILNQNHDWVVFYLKVYFQYWFIDESSITEVLYNAWIILEFPGGTYINDSFHFEILLSVALSLSDWHATIHIQNRCLNNPQKRFKLSYTYNTITGSKLFIHWCYHLTKLCINVQKRPKNYKGTIACNQTQLTGWHAQSGGYSWIYMLMVFFLEEKSVTQFYYNQKVSFLLIYSASTMSLNPSTSSFSYCCEYEYGSMSLSWAGHQYGYFFLWKRVWNFALAAMIHFQNTSLGIRIDSHIYTYNLVLQRVSMTMH